MYGYWIVRTNLYNILESLPVFHDQMDRVVAARAGPLSCVFGNRPMPTLTCERACSGNKIGSARCHFPPARAFQKLEEMQRT